MPYFSIIIPVYNRGRLVCETLESVLGQRFKDYEIIVVDDGSTDDTSDILSEFEGQIHLIKQNNQGPEVARNTGASIATGDYLVFLDSDDLLMPWALEVYAKSINHFQQPKLIIGLIQNFFEENDINNKLPVSELNIFCTDFLDYYSKDRGVRTSASVIVIKHETFVLLGGFRQSCPKTFHADDLDFLLRAGTCGRTILIESPVTVAYRLHGSNSVCDSGWIVQGIRKLISNEFACNYPGGRKRSFDRRSLIGGIVYYQFLRCLSRGDLGMGFSLLFYGYSLVLDAILRKLLIKFKGRQIAINLGKVSN